MSVSPYLALPLQVKCAAINRVAVEDAQAHRLREIARCAELIQGSISFANSYYTSNVRLVVLPEYFLTSFPLGEPIPVWLEKGCIEINGAEYDAIGEIAQKHRIYLSANVYERDPHFPDLYFQTSFICDDTGNVVLRYRRLISMYAPTPHDVMDAYLDKYGDDSLFPVVETDIGKLACVASEEILYPEVSRALALNGAEIICHSSSEMGSPLATPKNIAKQARAFENMAYVVSANSGAITDVPFPQGSTDLHSQVVDYKGRVLAEAGPGESMCGCAEVNIDALRYSRSQPAMSNTLARQRLELFAGTYSNSVYPMNSMLKEGDVMVRDRSHFIAMQERAINKLYGDD